jgi:hypothetical protein
MRHAYGFEFAMRDEKHQRERGPGRWEEMGNEDDALERPDGLAALPKSVRKK